MAGEFDYLNMPAWMQGTALADEWMSVWLETGDGVLALEAIRRHNSYDEVFEGNRREDGSLRYDEGTYLGIVESFEDAFAACFATGPLPDTVSYKISEMTYDALLVAPAGYVGPLHPAEPPLH